MTQSVHHNNVDADISAMWKVKFTGILNSVDDRFDRDFFGGD